LIGLVVVSLLIAGSVYLQVIDGVMPCPLCVLQRLCFGLLGIFFLIGLIVSASRLGRMLVNFFSTAIAIIGLVLAGRQVWLQHFHSADGGECGVSLQYMLQILPLNEVMQKVFAGSAECSQRGWEFLTLNIAEWSLIWFILFLLLIGYLFVKEASKH
jgi:disulfide bond formation protein DsbB